MMAQAEQMAKEKMEKATEQKEETEKRWALARKCIEDVLELDLDSDTYHIAVPLMKAIDEGIKKYADAVEAQTAAIKEHTEAMRDLSEELKASRPASKIPVPEKSGLKIRLTRPRIYEDGDERATRRQRTKSPSPRQSPDRERDQIVSSPTSFSLTVPSCIPSKSWTNIIRARQHQLFEEADFLFLQLGRYFLELRPLNQIPIQVLL